MFVVFDIETTGFSEITSDIIEFAYIMFDSNYNYVKAEQLFFYYDGMSWSEEAYAVHRIPLEFLKTQKYKFRENLIKMYTVLNGANVIGHNNIRFDCPFTKTWLMRQGIRNLEYGIVQDTMVAYKPVYKRSSIKLTKLVDYINVDKNTINALLPIWFPGAGESHAHEAAYDVVATALLALRGIEKKLISFEPLVKLAQDVNPNDMSELYKSGKALSLSNFDYIIRVSENEENKWKLLQHNPDGKLNKIIDTVAVNDMLNQALREYKVLPIVFTVNSDGSYIGEYGDVKFVVDPNAINDFEMVVSNPYFTCTNSKLDIPKVIANTFQTDYTLNFVNNQED